MLEAEVSQSSREGVVLTDLEKEVIDVFVQVARILGQPKSIGEIYGLLFISEKALPMDAIIEKLQMSKGSASQGLRFLRNMRAVKVVYVFMPRRSRTVPLKSWRQGCRRTGWWTS